MGMCAPSESNQRGTNALYSILAEEEAKYFGACEVVRLELAPVDQFLSITTDLPTVGLVVRIAIEYLTNGPTDIQILQITIALL